MQCSAKKMVIARYSGGDAESGSRMFKISPNGASRHLMAARRINTQAAEKKGKQHKYVFKKSKDDFKQNNNSNLSKESFLFNMNYNLWDRAPIHENEWAGPTAQPRRTIKKSAAQRFTYSTKMKELEKLIKGKKDNQPKLERCSNSQNSLKHKSKSRFFVDYDCNTNRKSTERNWADDILPKYQIMYTKLLGSGTFGKVFAGVCNKTGKSVAIKTFENDKSHKCREIELMEMMNSKFVIKIVDKFTTIEKNKDHNKEIVHIVMPKYESSFFQFLKARNYSIDPAMLKVYLYQIFKGVSHLHERGICHRDLKPQNILISKNRLVICDLGSAKLLKKDEANISYICSRCYRAPELIFGSTFYSFYIDIWSIGCIILEIINRGPFFIAKDSLHHLIEIMKVMGTPTKTEVLCMNPNYDITSFEDIPLINKKCWKEELGIEDELLFDLISKIMIYNPHKRLTAKQALSHQYFADLSATSFRASVAQEIDCCEILASI